jgi:hypothetical protein
MRVLTVIVIVIVTVIVTAVATMVIVKKKQNGGFKHNGNGNWLDSILGQTSQQPSQTSEPSILDRIKTLVAETSVTYANDVSKRRVSEIETIREKRTPERDGKRRSEDRVGRGNVGDVDRDGRDSGRDGRDSGRDGRDRDGRDYSKEKRGDKKERERKRVYESRCREILEKIFNAPFPKKRPTWLRNEIRDSKTGTGTMQKLELDCYNDKLKLALEYNGIQHRVYPNTWHSTKKEYKDQKKRDRLKIVRCEEEDVKLIVVPDTVPYEQLYKHITEKLETMGVIEFDD